MRSAKSGDWWHIHPHRALSNNSVAYTETPDPSAFMKEWLSLYESKSGERGIFSREASTNKAKENGCEFHELKPNMMAILYNRVNSYAKKNDIQMLPYAFDHIDYRNNLKQRAEETFKEHLVDHLVISAGSGVTSSGVVQAYQPGNDLFSNSDKQAHIITVSNINAIYEKYKSHSISSSSINVDKTKFDFADMMIDYEVPFPCNGTWDRKAWWWLEQMESQLEGDILFWNIGGNI